MIKVITLVCEGTAAPVPVIITGYDPGASVLVPFNVTVTLLPAVTGLGVKLTVVPAGFPDAESEIGPAQLQALVLITADVLTGTGQADTTGAGELKANPDWMVKSLLERSKNILPTASIFIFAVVVGIQGMVNGSIPSLGVLALNIVG